MRIRTRLALLALTALLTGCYTWVSDSQVVWSTPTRHLEITLDGEVELALEGEPIRYLSPGGRLRIDDRSSRKRQLLAVGQEDGSVKLRYLLDGEDRQIDAQARLWMRDVVEDIIRKTPIGARSRARRILEERGPSGILWEVEKGKLSSSSVYLEELIHHPGVSASQLSRAVAVSSREFSSSSRLRDLLCEVAPIHARDAELTAELISATRGISSSQAASEALQVIFKRRPLPARVARTVGAALPDISSSSAQAQALRALFASPEVDAEVLHAAIDSVPFISSSSAQADALEAVLRRGHLDLASQQKVAMAAISISSSSSQEAVLRPLAQTCDLDDQVVSTLLQAVSEISAARCRRNVLEVLIERDPLPSSAHDRLRVLIEDLPSSYATPLFSKMLKRHAR